MAQDCRFFFERAQHLIAFIMSLISEDHELSHLVRRVDLHEVSTGQERHAHVRKTMDRGRKDQRR